MVYVESDTPDYDPVEVTTDGEEPAAAVDESAAPKTDTADPFELLAWMSDYLAAQPSFRIELTDTIDRLDPSGARIQLLSRRTHRVMRPNKIFSTHQGDNVDNRVWYDGKTITLLDVKANMYGVVDAPDTIDAALDFVVEKYGVAVQLVDLLYTDVYGA